MLEVKDIGMNDLEKRSFYSFVILYIVSSSFFIVLGAYWYYSAQKSALENNDYYKLQHIADGYSQKIISSHMQGKPLPDTPKDKLVYISLIDTQGKIVRGRMRGKHRKLEEGYSLNDNGFSGLVSSSPQKHQNIKYVVVQSPLLSLEMQSLKLSVIAVMMIVLIVIMSLAWVLSKLFMRPVHQKIKQIEDFVHDTAHELNTPITALSMSVSRAIKKESYDAKALTNISISTKQLFDIYTALSYLSFEKKEQDVGEIDIKKSLEKSVGYYQELSESKGIILKLEAEAFYFRMDEAKTAMLFGNLISNAIKYSHPDSIINISLKEGIFCIQDYGIGIEEEKLTKIYEKYNRETEYAGGFGIGLSIVQKITQEYNLGLDVDSSLNKGSIFSIDFKTAVNKN